MHRHVDFGRVAADYARYRGGFTDALYERLAAAGFMRAGERVLDLGTGTGTVARALARRGCTVTGLDPTPALLAEAQRLDAELGVAVAYVEGRAERSGLRGQTFDGITAGQCWHWLDSPKAALECKRLLVPGGWLVIAHFDWIPLPGNVAEATEELIEQYNPEWTFGGGTGLYPAFLRDVRVAGFDQLETFSFDVMVPFSHETWRGRMRVSAGVLGGMPRDVISRFDETLRSRLADRFPEEPMHILHRAWALTCRRPAA